MTNKLYIAKLFPETFKTINMKKNILLFCMTIIFAPAITRAQFKDYYNNKKVDLDTILSSADLEYSLTLKIPKKAKIEIKTLEGVPGGDSISVEEFNIAMDSAHYEGYSKTETEIEKTAWIYEVQGLNSFLLVKVFKNIELYGLNVKNKRDNPFPVWKKKVSFTSFIRKKDFHDDISFDELFRKASASKFRVAEYPIEKRWVIAKIN